MSTQDMIISRQVTLTGIKPLMFDRYSGNKLDQLEPIEKLYLAKDKKTLIIPATNIMSFLSSQNAESAPQRIMGRAWKPVAKAALSFVNIDPLEIPIIRNNEPVTKDSEGITIDFRVARMKKGALVIPNEKYRPVLSLPWQISFTISLFRNNHLSENILKRLFEEGGLCIGLGTYRGVFGKFIVDKWI